MSMRTRAWLGFNLKIGTQAASAAAMRDEELSDSQDEHLRRSGMVVDSGEGWKRLEAGPPGSARS